MKKLFITLSIILLFISGIYAQTGKMQITEKVFEEKNTEKRYEIGAKYPQLDGNSAAVKSFNEMAKKLVMEQVADFKKSMAEFTDEDRGYLPEGSFYSLDAGYNLAALSEDLISVGYWASNYSGGAHPNSLSFALNYDLKNNRRLELADMFKAKTNYLKFISDSAINDLKPRMNYMSDDEWLRKGAGPEMVYFRSWTIYKDGLHFQFDPYQVAAYAAGSFEYILPYSKIPATMQNDNLMRAQKTEFVGDNPPNWCRNGLFPKSQYFSLAKIKGAKGSRTYFYSDDKDCPSGANCRMKSYIVPGDEIIVSNQYGSYVCAWYEPTKGAETVGWIEAKDMEYSYDDSQPNWIGKWSYYENDIQFVPAKRNGAFMISGTAFWKGAGDNVHTGEISGTEAPDGNMMKIGADDKDEFACKVDMTILGKYLIVKDNMNCGGANVSFSGVYTKKK